MSPAQKFRESLSSLRGDVVGAGFHILSGAGGDLRLLVQQAVSRMVGDAYVSRAEYEALAARLAKLEGAMGKKPGKTAQFAAAHKTNQANHKRASKKRPKARK